MNTTSTSAPTGAAWAAAIGLEVHCQLATQSKLFCPCPNRFQAAPNSLICPTCAGLPGSLPVLNAHAVELALRAALALSAEPNRRSIFERKHYVYPDLPKGYQISQYETPLASGGTLELEDGSRPRLVRIHMEEDAGKLIHAQNQETWVDLNRAGLALIEIVGEPDLHGAEQAAHYMERLREELVFAGVSSCDMEKGELRADVNVSVARAGLPLGTKVEVKNLNSFKHVRAAIEFEIARQIAVLESGGRVRQETRLFDAGSGTTRSMRSKEDALDYRYFPEPDLPPLELSTAQIEQARTALLEGPLARRRRYEKGFGLSSDDARTLTGWREFADLFEAVVRRGAQAGAAAKFLCNDVLGALAERGQSIEQLLISPFDLAELLALLETRRISATAARKVLAAMLDTGRAPRELARELGLEQIDDPEAIARWCHEALAKLPRAASEVRAGEEKALGPLIGLVLKLSGNRANPPAVRAKLLELIHAQPD